MIVTARRMIVTARRMIVTVRRMIDVMITARRMIDVMTHRHRWAAFMPSFPGTQPETVSELLALAAVAEDAARDSARSGPFECPPLHSLMRTAALTLGVVILLECASRRLPQACDAT